MWLRMLTLPSIPYVTLAIILLIFSGSHICKVRGDMVHVVVKVK